jgi:TRAP-type mannitol/chloroaromatic compound transport system substrate-binding protein
MSVPDKQDKLCQATGRELWNRRQFVAGAGIGAAAAASAFPRPAIAQGTRELKMVTIWPKTLPGLQSGAERVAATISALSGGRLNVKVFAAGQLVGAFESFDAVSSGLADIYHASEITRADPVRTRPNPAMIGSCEARYARAQQTGVWKSRFGGVRQCSR